MAKLPINPDSPVFRGADGRSIFERFEYSAAMRAGDFIYVAGQIGLSPDGSMPDDIASQSRNAFERMRLILEAAGSSLGDIVELVSYHVGLNEPGHLPAFVEVKHGFINAPYPSWTILGIAQLARPGLLIEIKAVAYVG
jgi:enamine deaminase RidA (YjgF/YER057c/UK114 family)